MTIPSPPPRCHPVVFEGCFGWIHPAPGRRGVVLCSPYGHEETSAHRLWRQLACQLAAAGLPVLRFDYHGTGDSAGAETDPQRVEAWLHSLRAAIRCLRAQTGVDEVSLAGLRLGGLAAALVAAELDGTVESLALIAPPSSGRAYVRELKALSRVAHTFIGTPPPRPEWKDDVEVAGHVFTAETLTALAKIDLLELAHRPARRVVVLGRADVPLDPRLAARMRTLGAEVEEGMVSYATLVPNAPHHAGNPEECFTLLTRWFSQGMPACAPAASPATPPSRLDLPQAVETAVTFGRQHRLFGILCRPKGGEPGHGRPAMLFLNSGANHHIGISRSTVTLARQLAARGVCSLRIDVAGIGDSDVAAQRGENSLFDLSACVDVLAALDVLQAAGFPRVVVAGLCSGAYLALHSALRDERIVGVTLVNLAVFLKDDQAATVRGPVPGMRSRDYYLKSLLKVETWRRLLKGHINVSGVVKRLSGRVWNDLRGRLRRLTAGHAEENPVLQMFRGLAERQVRCKLIYALEDEGLPIMEAALGPRAREAVGRWCDLKIIEGADHNMSQRWAAEIMAESLVELLEASRLEERLPLKVSSPNP